MLELGRRIRADRDAKWFEFTLIDAVLASKLINASVSELREMLMKQEVTSAQLVSFYGDRAQRIGRSHNLTCDELFEAAMK